MPYRQWLGIWVLLVTLLPLSATAEEGAEDKNEG